VCCPRTINNIIIPNTVTIISATAFCDCSNLTSITIPNSVKSIGGQAFQGCINITSIEIPKSVTSIGSSALGFYDVGFGYEDKRIDGFIIKCYSGSAAETYAKNNNIKYEIIG